MIGSPLQQYKQKIRLPRIRTPGTLNNKHFTLYNVSSIAFDLSFPEELTTYGLSEAMLNKVFTEVENYKRPLSWCVKGIPYISFYQVLHQLLKKWPRFKSLTKSSIGRFYMAIDKNLQAKGCRPDNTYLFIEKVAL